MTFIFWLKKQTKRGDNIGDLAVDVIRDKTKVRTYKGLKSRMEFKGACDGAMTALDDAYREWLGPDPMFKKSN